MRYRAYLDALPIWGGQIQAVRGQTEEAIVALTVRFIHEQIRDALVQLQFQDRTGQMLTQVATSMAELPPPLSTPTCANKLAIMSHAWHAATPRENSARFRRA